MLPPKSRLILSIAALALGLAVIAMRPAAGQTGTSGMADLVAQAQREYGLVGLGAACVGEGGLVTASAGHTGDPAQSPLTPNTRFHVGSIAKTFTAATTLSLAGEGVLRLDAPLATWYPEYPNAEAITLRHLLGMTAGTFDFFQADAENPVIAIIMEDVARRWRPDEMIAIAAQQAPRHAPGTAYAYSNTNYLLLGRIIEQETGADLETVFRQRLFAPLGLGTVTLAGAHGPSGPMAHGYLRGSAFLFGENAPFSAPPEALTGLASLGWAAGGMTATPGDLAIWGAALAEGRVLPAPVLEKMSRPGALSQAAGMPYGLGLEIYQTELGRAYGHTGSIPGFAALLMVFPELGLSVAVLTNDESGEAALNDLAVAIAATGCAG